MLLGSELMLRTPSMILLGAKLMLGTPSLMFRVSSVIRATSANARVILENALLCGDRAVAG